MVDLHVGPVRCGDHAHAFSCHADVVLGSSEHQHRDGEIKHHNGLDGQDDNAVRCGQMLGAYWRFCQWRHAALQRLHGHMRVQIALFHGFDEIDVFGPFEALAAGGAEVELAAVHGAGIVRSQRGVSLNVDSTFLDPTTPHPDGVIVPGGGWLNRAECGAWAEVEAGTLPRALAAASGELSWIASVCSGGMILAHAGILRGHRATTNRACLEEFRPLVGDVVDERVVDDGKVITAGALTSGLDLGVHLIRRFRGEKAADQVIASLEYPPICGQRCREPG